MRTPLTIIVPAKLENITIVPTLKVLARHVHTPHNIIVVNISDDKDPTSGLVKTYMLTHSNISLVKIIHPHGTFGMALRKGFQAANTDVVVPFMADSCDDPKDIDRMYGLIQQGWDVVVASRYMKGGKKIGGPATQSLFSWIVSSTFHSLTGIPTSDVSNAFKMYKRSALSGISISETSGVEASMEIVLHAYFNGMRITEIPTVWKGRTKGYSKFNMVERIPRYLKVYLWALITSII